MAEVGTKVQAQGYPGSDGHDGVLAGCKSQHLTVAPVPGDFEEELHALVLTVLRWHPRLGVNETRVGSN